MNLYLISQTQNNDYYTYDSAIVCAESAEKAAYVSPSGHIFNENDDSGLWGGWGWCEHPKYVSVELIGTASEHIPPGVVIASFNAG